jgi:hypothetical protein
MRKQVLALPALIALLAGSAVGVTAEERVGRGGLVTEEVAPGVERVIRDELGHDLDEKHPTYRYDMDAIAITSDGTVWLRTTYSREDNEANPGGPLVWAIGREDTYILKHEIPPPNATYLFVQPDGTKSVIAYEVVTSEDGAFIPDFEAVGIPSQMEDERAVLVAGSDGEHRCWNMGDSVTCEDPSGETTTYLSGTPINQIAAAPDGKLWAVGGYDGDNGGLYRITLD